MARKFATTKEDVIRRIREALAKGDRIFTPTWTHSYGRTAFTQAVRILNAAGEIERDPDGSAHWIARPRVRLFTGEE